MDKAEVLKTISFASPGPQNTERMFGQGVKVGVELSLMAADAGLVRTDQAAAVIGGTGSGADSGLVVTPANSHRCLELKVHEIIAKPRL
ncbi:MAG: hypothetical protein K9K79_11675 [Desulfohalobiaceae bacterium]|nr:hypothetical protein [Desulfohalobiaceae bacterium]